MDTSTHTYWLSIGRNVGAEPMSGRLWELFRHDVDTLPIIHDGAVLATVHGSSSWEGIEEETYLVLATIPTYAVENVRTVLAALATYYRQDGSGFVGGPGTDTYVTADR